ncbi:MAG: hypothetical protein E7179_03275, partial [Erysipelotrichaceae bacterium]|nr:hypothetical protein [Erysipelotrichaceae bacterium]
RFFATIGLSAMAMVVATIGTFAWFQARSSGADPRHEVEAGSAGLTISDVKGYKYKYTQRDLETTDYSSGAVGERDLTNPATQGTNNHQDASVPLTSDVPSEGVGYYVVFSASDYLYSGAKKMSTNDIGSDKALITNVPLTSGTFFDIRRHYYVKENEEVFTRNEIIPLTASGSSTGINTTKQADAGHNSELHWKVTATGNYDIYINASSQLYVQATTSKARNALSARPSNTLGPKRAPDGSHLDGSYTEQTGTASAASVFLDTYNTSNGWPKDGARICIHWWNGSTTEGLIKMKVHSGAIYFANLPATITGYRFVRLDNTTWYYLDNGHLWNYTGDITDSSKRSGVIYKMENFTDRGWQSTTTTGGGITKTDSYCVVGSMNGWVKTAGYVLTAQTSTISGQNFTHKISALSIGAGATFKIGTNVNTSTAASTVKYSSTTLYTTAASSSDEIVWAGKPEGNWNNLFEPGGYSKTTYMSLSGGSDIKMTNAKTVNIYFNSSSSSTYIEFSFSVTLNTNSGTIVDGNVTSYSYGVGATLPTNVTRSGYAFAGWYANSSFTGSRITAISTTDYGNKTYYAKWVSKSEGTTYYATVDTGCSWTGIKVFVFSDAFSTFNYVITPEAASPYTNVYQFKIPTDSCAEGFLIFNATDSSPQGDGAQTGNIKAGGSLNSDSFSVAPGSHNMIHIVAEQDGSNNRKWEWMDFVSTKPATDGYYISKSNAWGSTTMVTESVAGNNTAVKLGYTTGANFTFQIWKIKNNNWFIYRSLAAACEASAYQGKLRVSAAGTYDFYLNADNQVYVANHSLAQIVFSKLNGSTPVGSAGTFDMHVANANLTMGEANVYNGNRYAYEETISVAAGDTFNIKLTEGSSGPSNVKLAIDTGDYVEGTDTPELDSGKNKYASFRVKVAGSYTFYWTSGSPNQLSMAPIPEMGFGYYILKNQGTAAQPVFSYSSCVKMKEVDTNESYTNRAFYYSYYAKAGETLAFRSYVDEVDTYYLNANAYYSGTSLVGKTAASNPGAYPVNSTNHSSASDSAKAHGIVIKTAGYYNFFITWDSGSSKFQIHIAPADSVSDFFKLNKVDSTKVSTADAIKAQNTAFVLAVTFTANNPYGASIYADALVSSTCNLRFTALLDTDISGCATANDVYSTIKDAAYTKDSWGACTNGTASQGGSLAAGNSSSHTLYIVIDYTPGSTISAYSGRLGFSIRTAQA